MKERSKMPREMRAKQFAPFDALKGLTRALKEKEEENELDIENVIKHIKDKDTSDFSDIE